MSVPLKGIDPSLSVPCYEDHCFSQPLGSPAPYRTVSTWNFGCQIFRCLLRFRIPLNIWISEPHLSNPQTILLITTFQLQWVITHWITMVTTKNLLLIRAAIFFFFHLTTLVDLNIHKHRLSQPHSIRHTKFSSTTQDEGSARRRDVYLSTQATLTRDR
jgi:hypothetical protein